MIPKSQYIGPAESLEEAQKRREIDSEFVALKEKPLDLDGAKKAMGGMGEIPVEQGKKVSQKAAELEAGDKENPDDILDAFDTPENPQLDTGEISIKGEAITGNQGDNTLQKNNNTEDIKNKEPTPENIEGVTQGDNSEYGPLITQFAADGKISTEEYNTLQECSINGDNFNETINAVNIDPKCKKNLIENIGYLEKPEHTKNAGKELLKNNSDIFNKFQNNQSPESNNEISWKNPATGDAFNELAKHYIGGNENPEIQKQQINLALEMSANALGKRAQLGLNPSNQETYEQAMKTAKNGEASFQDKFTALTEVSKIINTSIGAIASKGKQKALNIQTTLQELGLSKKFQQQQAALKTAQESGDKKQIGVAQNQLKETLKIAQEKSGGDIGSFDIALESGGKDASENSQKAA